MNEESVPREQLPAAPKSSTDFLEKVMQEKGGEDFEVPKFTTGNGLRVSAKDIFLAQILLDPMELPHAGKLDADAVDEVFSEGLSPESCLRNHYEVRNEIDQFLYSYFHYRREGIGNFLNDDWLVNESAFEGSPEFTEALAKIKIQLAESLVRNNPSEGVSVIE